MVPRNEPRPFKPALQRQPSQSKSSIFSPTPSVEGDDERSSVDHSLDEMEPDNEEHLRYEDEDTRPTSQKELAGWYSYGWAAEVFIVVGLASFIPITLEQLSREEGFLANNHTQSCPTTLQDVKSSLLLARTITGPKHTHEELPACVVKIGGAWVNTASFAMYTFSISVLIQALLIISMSGAADHGHFRKLLLLSFGFTGATATMLFIVVVPKIYLLGALLAIVANTCAGASFVLLNSYLPVLVRHHPSLAEEQEATWTETDLLLSHSSSGATDSAELDEEEPNIRSTSVLLPIDRPDITRPSRLAPAALSPALKLSTKISSNGVAVGYVAGLMVQAFAILLVVATGSTTFSLRLVLFVVGAWWFAFSIPAALWLRPRPGPPLPPSLSDRGWAGYFLYSWQALFKTAGHARRLKDIVIFLGALFMIGDSIATVSGTATLFAKTTLGMKTPALAMISVIGTLSGIVGAVYWSFISRLFNLRATHTIAACICLFEIIPLYAMLAFIPAVREYGVFGLQQPWEMYPLGALYGFILGGLSSYGRALFGELIPPGFEAAFYALYAITDKGSSVFGPAIVGAITDRYGEIRPAFVFLSVLIFLPLPLILLVDVDRGKAEARALALELAGKGKSAVPEITFTEEQD